MDKSTLEALSFFRTDGLLNLDTRRGLLNGTLTAFENGLTPLFRNSAGEKVWEWADKYRVLGRGSARQRYSSALAPYLREPMEAMVSRSPDCQVTVLSKPTQVGGTEAVINAILYRIHRRPCSILTYFEDEPKAKRFLKVRYDEAFAHEPFRGLGITRAGNERYFPGGFLFGFGTGSPAALSSTEGALVAGDEVARFKEDIGGEGGWFALAESRCNTFGREAKILAVSTFLTQMGQGRQFYNLFASGDCREFFCPCPACGEMHIWSHERLIEIPGGTVVHPCPACGKHTRDGDEKMDCIRAGEWRPTVEPEDGRVRSYRVSGLLSHPSWLRTWKLIYDQWVKVKAGKADPQPFFNTMIGLWHDREEGVATDPEAAQTKTTMLGYKVGEVPVDVCLLTAAVDVQMDYLVVDVTGWDRFRNSYVLERIEIQANIKERDRVKKEIDALLARAWAGLNIWLLLIDSGGRVRDEDNPGGHVGSAQYVYDLCNLYRQPGHDWARRSPKAPRTGFVQAIKGTAGRQAAGKLIVSLPGRSSRSGRRYSSEIVTVGVDFAKSELYRSLASEYVSDEGELKPGVVYAAADLPENYWKELTAEKLVLKQDSYGRPVMRYENLGGRANEALDLWVYNRAAFDLIGAPRWVDSRWDALEKEASRRRLAGDTAKAVTTANTTLQKSIDRLREKYGIKD